MRSGREWAWTNKQGARPIKLHLMLKDLGFIPSGEPLKGHEAEMWLNQGWKGWKG